MVAQSAGGLNVKAKLPRRKDSQYQCQLPFRSETYRHDIQWPVREGGVAVEVENNSSLDVDLCLTRRTLRAHSTTGGQRRESHLKRGSQTQGLRLSLMSGRRSVTPGLPAVSRGSLMASPIGKRPNSVPASSPPPWPSPSPPLAGTTPSCASTALPPETPPPARTISSARSTPSRLPAETPPPARTSSSARSTPSREELPPRPASQAYSARGADSPAPQPPLRANIRAQLNARLTWEAAFLPPRPESQMQTTRKGEGVIDANSAQGSARSASRAGATASTGATTASPTEAMSHPRSVTPGTDLASELAGREAPGRRTDSSLGTAGQTLPGSQNGWLGDRRHRPPAERSELVRWCFRNSHEQIKIRLRLLDRSTFSEEHRKNVYKDSDFPEGCEAVRLLRLYEQMGLKAVPHSGHPAALESWGVREGGCSRTSELLMAFEVLNFYRWLCGVPRLQINSCCQELADLMLHVLMKRDARVHMRPEGAPHLCEFLAGFGNYIKGGGGRAVVVSQVPAAPASMRLLFSGLPAAASSSTSSGDTQDNAGAITCSTGDHGFPNQKINIGAGSADHGAAVSTRGMPMHPLHGADLPMWTLSGADARTEGLALPVRAQDALRGYVPFLRLSRLGVTDDGVTEASPLSDAAGGDSAILADGLAGGRVRCVPVDEDDMPDPPPQPEDADANLGVTLKPSSLGTLLNPTKQAKDRAKAASLQRRRRTRAWGDISGIVAFRRCILDPRLRSTGLMRRGCRTCLWTDTEEECKEDDLELPVTLEMLSKAPPDVNFLDPEPIEEVERYKSSEALQKLHGWREEMSRRLTPGVVTGSEGMMGFHSAGDTFAEMSDSLIDPWGHGSTWATVEGDSIKSKEACFVAQTTNMQERVKERERHSIIARSPSPESTQDDKPLMVCFPPPGIVPIDEIEVASLLWTISPDPARLAPTSRCKVQVFRVSIDVERGKADRICDEEVPLSSFCVDCTDVGTPFCVIFSLGIEIEAGDQFEVVLSGLMGLQPAELVSVLRYFVSFEYFRDSVHDLLPIQQRAERILASFQETYLWDEPQWHCPGEAPGEDEFFALVTASRAARAKGLHHDSNNATQSLKGNDTTSVLGSTHGSTVTSNTLGMSKGADRFANGLSSVLAASSLPTVGRRSLQSAVSQISQDIRSGHDASGSKALFGRFRPPQVHLVQRTEYNVRSPPPFGLVAHPNGTGSPAGGQTGRYTIEAPSGNEISIALVVPSTIIAKASIMYFVKSSAKWEVFPHGVLAQHMDCTGGSEAPQSLLSLLEHSKAKLPQCPRKHRLLFRVMLPLAGKYELRFHWGYIPGDTSQCRNVTSTSAPHEHPLRIAISLGGKVPMYRPLVPTFFHATTKRLGYPMKHPLAEHYGVTLMGPLRYRLKIDSCVRFTVLANQGKPVTSKTFAALEPDPKMPCPRWVEAQNLEAAMARDLALKAVEAQTGDCSARLRQRSNSASSSANEASSRSSSKRATSPIPHGDIPTQTRASFGAKVRFKDSGTDGSATGSDRDVWHGDGLKSDALLDAVQVKIAEHLRPQVRSGTAGQICIVAVLGSWRRVVLLRRRLLEAPPPPAEVADLAATAGSATAAEAALASVARSTEIHEAIVNITDEDHNQPVQLYVFQVGAAEAAESSFSTHHDHHPQPPPSRYNSQTGTDTPRSSTKQAGGRASCGDTLGSHAAWHPDHTDRSAGKHEDRMNGAAPPLGRMLPPARWCLAEFFVEGANPLPYDEDEMAQPLPPPGDPVEMLGFDRPV